MGGLGKRHVGISGLVAATVDISTHTISTYLQHIYNISIYLYVGGGHGLPRGRPGSSRHGAAHRHHHPAPEVRLSNCFHASLLKWNNVDKMLIMLQYGIEELKTNSDVEYTSKLLISTRKGIVLYSPSLLNFFYNNIDVVYCRHKCYIWLKTFWHIKLANSTSYETHISTL